MNNFIYKNKKTRKCRKDDHRFNVASDECIFKHCNRCGVCQCLNGCDEVILEKSVDVERVNEAL